MTSKSQLKELRVKELTILRERVTKRIKLRPLAKSVRRMVGVDVVITARASKVHVCASLMSVPKMEILEEAIATDELDMPFFHDLGNLVLVPLILSVLKMLKRKTDVIVIRELSVGADLPLASYIGVISGRPAFGVTDRPGGLAKLAPWEGVKRAGTIKIRGQAAGLGIVAGHLLTLKDATAIVRSTTRGSRFPEAVCNAQSRVRAWEREWKKTNL
jgi:deoxyinosine 3'endonuclease (endonuclease V)